jgi:single-stranded DNA-binding protein
MARLTLIGNLAKDPESRLTKNEKEFMVYVATLLASGYLSTTSFN